MADHLQAGFRLDEYEIRRVVHWDSLCAEYEATVAESGSSVIVKEYLPASCATRASGGEVSPTSAAEQGIFDAGLARFLAQYQALRHIRHPAIVPIRECLTANGTGYAVLANPQGETLAARLRGGATLPEGELESLLAPVVAGLARVHQSDLLHGAINLDNIVLQSDETPILLGCGAVSMGSGGPRQTFNPRSPSAAGHLTAGFAALEQYSERGHEGPWTDIYALGAVLYRCVTGVEPPDAPGRALHDDLIPSARAAQGRYSAHLLRGIDAALALRVAERPQNLGVWRVLPGDSPETKAMPRARMTARRTMTDSVAQGNEQRRPNWVLPAVVATALISLLTWVDTGVLRSSGGEPPAVAATAAGLNHVGEPATDVPDGEPEIRSVTNSVQSDSGAPEERNPGPAAVDVVMQATPGTKLVGAKQPVDKASEPSTPLPTDEPAWQPGIARDATGETSESVAERTGSLESRKANSVVGDHDDAGRKVIRPANDVTAAPSPNPQSRSPEPAGARRRDAISGTGRTTVADVSIKNEDTETVVLIGNAALEARAASSPSSVAQEIAEVSRGPQPFTVSSEPSDAVVRFAGGGESYETGMLLSAGDYKIVVALAGFETWTGTVAHGAAPTSRQVTLVKQGREFSDPLTSGGYGPAMVTLSPGVFRMGCVSGVRCFSNELPVREEEVEQGFALSKYEITFDDYDRFASVTGRQPAEAVSGWGRGTNPVINVGWEDAVAYADWLSLETGRLYRLPLESEWEYAARAGGVAPYSWGNLPAEGRARCDGCGGGRNGRRTAPVGSFAPNAWGLHDMHGNVWEWVANCPDRPQVSVGECLRRIRRGGSWTHSPRRMRSASRDVTSPSLQSPNTGFRVLVEIQ